MMHWRFWRRAGGLLAALLTIPALAADSAPSALPAPGVSSLSAVPAYLTPVVREFEQLEDRIMRTGQVTGMAVVVVKDGVVISQRALGVTEVDTQQPVGTDTAFRLASLSKAFAATLTAMLVREGYLQWEDRVQDLVPAFELSDSRESTRVTVQDLLSHRVGLPHNAHDLLLERDEPYPLLVHKLRDLPMLCSVGDCYAYQNIAYSLIGDVTFASTGDFFYHQVEKRLFHPLGMDHATYGRDAIESSNNWARPHVRRGHRWVALRPKESYYRVPPAAGVNASIGDLTQWLLAQLGHRPDVLPAELLEEVHKPLVATPGERISASWKRVRVTAANYALGWRVYDYAGQNLVFHAGAVQGYRAMVGMLPEHDLGVAVLWNCESGVPAGLLPTLLDRYLGLPTVDWLQLDRFPQRPVLAAARAP